MYLNCLVLFFTCKQERINIYFIYVLKRKIQKYIGPRNPIFNVLCHFISISRNISKVNLVIKHPYAVFIVGFNLFILTTSMKTLKFFI